MFGMWLTLLDRYQLDLFQRSVYILPKKKTRKLFRSFRSLNSLAVWKIESIVCKYYSPFCKIGKKNLIEFESVHSMILLKPFQVYYARYYVGSSSLSNWPWLLLTYSKLMVFFWILLRLTVALELFMYFRMRNTFFHSFLRIKSFN